MSTPAPSIPGDVTASAKPDYPSWWDEFWASFFRNVVPAGEAVGQGSVSLVAGIATILIEVLIQITAEAGRRFGESIDEFESTAGPKILEAAARGLSDYFGTSVSPGQLNPGRPFSERFRFAEQLGRMTLDQMFGAFASPKGLTPDVGLDNAERLLGFNIATALESWIGQVTAEAPLLRFIPNWADLDDLLSANLGLGRANRRVMGPLLKTLIVDPLTWDLNRRFAPERLSVSELLRLEQRGAIDEAFFHEQMQWHGHDQANVSRLQNLASRLPEKEDVTRMLELELIDPARAAGIFRGLGFTDEGAEAMVALAVEDRVRTLNNSLETLARDMYRDREIDEAEYRSLLEAAGRGPIEVQTLLAIGELERSRPRPLPVSVYEEGFRRDLIPLGRLRSAYEALGYSLDDRVLLEELAVLDRERSKEREEQQKTKSEGGDFRAVPRAQIEQAYIEGRIPASRLRAWYEDREYSGDDVALLLELASGRKTESDRKQEEALAKAKTPRFVELPRATAEDAFFRDVIDASRLREYYELSGLSPENAGLALELARKKKAERAERLAEELRRAKTPRFAELPRSVMEEAFIRGDVDLGRLLAWYEAQAFRAEEIPILLELVTARKAEREAKAAAAATKPKA